MREIIILITILVLIFAPSVFLNKFLETSGREITVLLEDMDKDFAKGSLDSEKAKKLEEIFKEKESKWLLVLNHEILDELEGVIVECMAYYNGNDKVEFTAAYGKAKHYLEDFAKREKISIINLF